MFHLHQFYFLVISLDTILVTKFLWWAKQKRGMTTGQKIKRSAYQWQKNLLLGVWVCGMKWVDRRGPRHEGSPVSGWGPETRKPLWATVQGTHRKDQCCNELTPTAISSPQQPPRPSWLNLMVYRTCRGTGQENKRPVLITALVLLVYATGQVVTFLDLSSVNHKIGKLH